MAMEIQEVMTEDQETLETLNNYKAELERVIDHIGLHQLLGLIGSACNDGAHKATHYERSKPLARQWASAAKAIQRAASHKAVTTLPRPQPGRQYLSHGFGD